MTYSPYLISQLAPLAQQAVTDVPTWLTLAVQIPLVGIFIWFVLELNKRQTEKDKDIARAHDSEMKAVREQMAREVQERDEKWRTFLSESDSEWRAFIAEQRRAQHEDTVMLSGLLSEIAKSVSDGRAELARHDEWERNNTLVVRQSQRKQGHIGA